MERFTNNLRLFWGAERLLVQQEIRTGTKKLEIHALAGFGVFLGIGMLGVALFFAIAPHWGQALAALTVAGLDLIIAVVLVSVARTMKPSPEEVMVREVRDMALNGIKEEAALAEAEFNSLKNDIRGFAHNPLGTLLPAVASPMLGAVTRGLKGVKKNK